jgi:hypothetical protein
VSDKHLKQDGEDLAECQRRYVGKVLQAAGIIESQMISGGFDSRSSGS